jgi:hypothetical protein
MLRFQSRSVEMQGRDQVGIVGGSSWRGGKMGVAARERVHTGAENSFWLVAVMVASPHAP